MALLSFQEHIHQAAGLHSINHSIKKTSRPVQQKFPSLLKPPSPVSTLFPWVSLSTQYFAKSYLESLTSHYPLKSPFIFYPTASAF